MKFIRKEQEYEKPVAASSMTEVTESDGSVRIIHRDAAGNETYS